MILYMFFELPWDLINWFSKIEHEFYMHSLQQAHLQTQFNRFICKIYILGNWRPTTRNGDFIPLTKPQKKQIQNEI